MNNMKVGEAIKLKNVTLKCVEEISDHGCEGCFFNESGSDMCGYIKEGIIGECCEELREDSIGVIFIIN